MKWIREKYVKEAIKMVSSLPFLIHADTCKHQYKSYPTHTHGLDKKELPEIFINASAYGPQGNATMINIIATGLILDKKVRNAFFEKGVIELKTGVFEDDVVMCLRKVDKNFIAVKRAYHDNNNSPTGYAQLYVQGDDHVLKEEFYYQIPE